jgi:hypothetical protein
MAWHASSRITLLNKIFSSRVESLVIVPNRCSSPSTLDHSWNGYYCTHSRRPLNNSSNCQLPAMEDSVPVIRDFQATRVRSATLAAPSTTIPRISLDVPSPGPRRHNTLSPSGADRGRTSSMSSGPLSPTGMHRRFSRQNTVRTYRSPSRPTWAEPGAEPGIDTSKEVEPHFEHLMQECQITVVDFSDERMSKFELDNEGLVEFLQEPREDWVACRWINVNGLSWDVIKELGNKHNIHRLAIEDLMNTRKSRTKADWYSDHAFSRCLSLFSLHVLYF